MRLHNISPTIVNAVVAMMEPSAPDLTSESLLDAIKQYDSGNQAEQLPRLLSIKFVADHLAITPRTVWNLIERKQLKKVGVGRSARIPETSFKSYLNSIGVEV